MNTKGHVLGYSLYVSVWGGLLFLTALTVGQSYINLGIFNIVAALLIASLKASLVAMYFMHLKFESRLTWAFVSLPLALLALIIGSVVGDALLR